MTRDRDDNAKLVDELSREAREHWAPPAASEAGAEAAERALFAKIDAHEQLPQIGRRGGAARVWAPVVLVAAVAAGVLFFAGPRGEGPEADRMPLPTRTGLTAPVAESPRPTAPAELTAVTGGGALRVDGVEIAAREASLHDGQTVEARGGEAVFTAPGRVSWLLESGTDVGTTRAGTHGGAIVLALRVGAVEAQVTPVPNGEAFAVDVEGVRVAVHGTHLRVAREERGGTHVVVDLSEGVISVGAPPKAGSTVGLLVTAPAHVEFSVADVEHTLRVDHDPASVRAPVDPVSFSLERSPEPSVATAPIAAAAGARVVVGPSAMGPRVPGPAAKPPVDPTESILAAVDMCSKKLPAGGGAVTISSMLTVHVRPDGHAESAIFEPPLAPDLQSCASGAVWATRWPEAPEAAAHQIAIELHR